MPYEAFAAIYDKVMQDIDHKGWADFILKQYKSISGNRYPLSILDLACGSGLVTQFFPRSAKITGIDASASMISLARTRIPQGEFMVQNLQDIDPKSRFDLIISTHDSINYLLEIPLIEELFRKVFQALTPGGVFAFDLTTETNILENFDDQSLQEVVEDWFLHWQNSYDRSSNLLKSTLLFRDRVSDIYTEEVHWQRYYPPEKISECLLLAGFNTVTEASDYENKKVSDRTCLHNYFAQKL